MITNSGEATDIFRKDNIYFAILCIWVLGAYLIAKSEPSHIRELLAPLISIAQRYPMLVNFNGETQFPEQAEIVRAYYLCTYPIMFFLTLIMRISFVDQNKVNKLRPRDVWRLEIFIFLGFCIATYAIWKGYSGPPITKPTGFYDKIFYSSLGGMMLVTTSYWVRHMLGFIFILQRIGAKLRGYR